MRIQKLVVQETAPEIRVVREIAFVLEGANFIVDNTSAELIDSGNSIGKSTVAKIIDLCLSGKSVSSLYTDSETKNKDKHIEEYLKNNKLEAILELVDSNGKITKLNCSLFPNGYRKINGTKFNGHDYLVELNKIFFDLSEESPTFKQLISKFVRINANLDEHIFKFLAFAPNSVYESIYSFLFKLAEDDVVAQRANLQQELLAQEHISESFKRSKQLQSIELLEQKLLAIKNEIEVCRCKRSKFKYQDIYHEELEKNQILVQKLANKRSSIETCFIEIGFLDDSIEAHKQQMHDYDTSVLKILYDEADSLFEKINKQFDELVKFHNMMVANKINFLQSRKNQIKVIIENLQKEYNCLLDEKKQIALDIVDAGALEQLNNLNTKIEDLSKEQGEIEQSLNIWKENEDNIKRIKSLLFDLNTKTSAETIDSHISMFNEFFTQYTSRLYAESCVIAYNKSNDGSFPISLGNIGGVGSGKKKGLISAFDLAYYAFAVEKDITCPRFIVHDKMETTDKKQLQEIFNITEENKAQLIIPILNEKLSFLTDEQREKHVILKLSNEDKFFKIN